MLSLNYGGYASAELFLVSTTEGPGFADPKEVAHILEKGIIPTFNHLTNLQDKKKIIAGGLPVGSRTFHLMIEAADHDELDRLLRAIPAWGVFSWKVTPLQSIKGRATMEKRVLKDLKSKM